MSENFVPASPCTQCECADIMPSTQGICACGHSAQAHRPSEGYVMAPRGCRTGDTVFSAPNNATWMATPVEAGNLTCTTCGEKYLFHRILSQSQQTRRISSSTATATIPTWMRPGVFSDPDRSTVNQDRMLAAQRHRSPPPQMPARTRGISNNPLGPFPTVHITTASGNSSRSTSAGQPVRRPRQRQHRLQAGPLISSGRSAVLEANFLIIIHPEPYHGYLAPNSYVISPKDIRLASNTQTDKPARLARRADLLGLSFVIQRQVHGNTHILDDFTRGLLGHMQARNLSFNESAPSESPGPSSPPIASNEPCWRLLFHKQVERSASQFPKCYLMDQPTSSLTYADLQRLALKFPTVDMNGVLHHLLVIVPARNVIVGPLNGQGHHFCLAERLWTRLRTPFASEEGEPVQCYDFCSNNTTLDTPSALLPAGISLPDIPQTPHLTAMADDATIDPVLLAASDVELNRLPHNIQVPIPLAAEPASHIQPTSTSGNSDDRIEQGYGILRDVLEQIQPQVPFNSQFTVSTNNIDDGADALFDSLYSFYFDKPCPAFSSGTRVRNLNAAALNASECRIYIDAAVGRGPTQAAWTQLIKKIVSRTHHWVTTPTDDYFTPVDLPEFVLQNGDKQDFEFYGFIIRQSLLWGFDLFPISPFLLAIILDGEKLALQDNLIASVALDAAKRLATWPPKRRQEDDSLLDLEYGKDPLNLLAECDLLNAFSIQRLQSIPADDLKNFTPIIKRIFLFKISPANRTANILNPLNPLNIALRAGFFATDYGLLDISHALTPNILDCGAVITALYHGRKIQNPAHLLNHIVYQPVPLDSPDRRLYLDYDQLQERWKTLFIRYLEGKGHVQSDTFDSNSAALSTSPSSDPNTLRSLLFVQAVSASSYLPLAGSDDTFKINFVPKLEHAIAHLSGAHIRTCFKTIEILLDDQISRDVLSIDDAEITSKTQERFDCWLHALLLQPPNFNDA